MTRRLLILPVALVCALTTSCSTFAVAAATVNGDKITEAEVESELDRVRSDPTFQDLLQRQADELRGVARRNILTGLIRQTVLDQEAQRRNIRVTRAQVDRLIVEEARRQGLSVAEFRRAQNLTPDGARVIGERIVRLFEIRRQVTQGSNVDVERVRQAYEDQKDAFAEVHLWRITVANERDAQAALEDLNAGTDFEEVAEEHSRDDLADQGGDMGYVPLASLNTQVQAALEQTRIGGVTDPINTPSGVEIYRLTDRRPRSFEDVEDELRTQLLDADREQDFEEWLNRRIRAARIVVNPKYGRFDVQALQVVPGRRELRP